MFLLFKEGIFRFFHVKTLRGANTQTRLRLFFPWEFLNLRHARRPVGQFLGLQHLLHGFQKKTSLKKWRLGWCINQNLSKSCIQNCAFHMNILKESSLHIEGFFVFLADPGKCTRVRCLRNHFEVLKPLIGAMLANHG